MALNLISTFPSPISLPFITCFHISALLYSLGPKSDLHFPVIGIHSSILTTPAVRGRPGRSLILMVWNPFIEQDGGGPGSLPLSSSCALPLYPCISSESSELLNDLSMAPPCTHHLKAHTQGAGTILSNPNQRRGARIVNESFPQRG